MSISRNNRVKSDPERVGEEEREKKDIENSFYSEKLQNLEPGREYIVASSD